MKKALIFTLIAATVLLCGCVTEQPEITTAETTETTAISEITEPVSNQMDFIFLSGAGGWWTEMTVKEGGEFFGEYTDGNMGDATTYICVFDGKFKDFKKINDYTYSMSIDYINIRDEIGTEWQEDGMTYIASEPYGLDGGTEFLLYTPDTPVNELPFDFMIWMYAATDVTDTLGCYAIRNLANDHGFAQPNW